MDEEKKCFWCSKTYTDRDEGCKLSKTSKHGNSELIREIVKRAVQEPTKPLDLDNL